MVYVSLMIWMLLILFGLGILLYNILTNDENKFKKCFLIELNKYREELNEEIEELRTDVIESIECLKKENSTLQKNYERLMRMIKNKGET